MSSKTPERLNNFIFKITPPNKNLSTVYDKKTHQNPFS